MRRVIDLSIECFHVADSWKGLENVEIRLAPTSKHATSRIENKVVVGATELGPRIFVPEKPTA